MVDLLSLRMQIRSKVNEAEMKKGRTAESQAVKAGIFAKVINDAVIASDIRMYRREVFAYNGTHYESIDGALFTKLIIDLMSDLQVGYDFILNSRKKVIEFCIDNLIQKDIVPVKNIIPFKNCLLNTNTMEEMVHSPEHDILYCLDYNYDKDAKCPLWEKFLSQMLPKPGLVQVLQEYLGLLFIDREKYKIEKMLVLLGGGSNGKSVVFETIFRLLGERNVSTHGISKLIAGATSEYNLADIDGKILNYTSELDPKVFSSELTKKLISGEPVMARRIYADPVKLKNIPLFICNANKLPETDDKTHGFFRRLEIIPFDVTIAEKDQDKQLSVKLQPEYSGIMNWIIEGRNRIIAQNVQFTKVTDIERVKEAYRQTQDSIYGFIRTNLLAATGNESIKYLITDTELYLKYVDYCHEVTKNAYGKNVFIDQLVSIGFKKYKQGQVRGFYVFCDKNPSLHWNQDIRNVYDEDLDDISDLFEGEESDYEPKQEKIPF